MRQQPPGENTELGELLKNLLGSMAGTSEICEGSTAPVTNSSSEEESASATAEMREKALMTPNRQLDRNLKMKIPRLKSENENSESESGEQQVSSGASANHGKQGVSENETGRMRTTKASISLFRPAVL